MKQPGNDKNSLLNTKWIGAEFVLVFFLAVFSGCGWLPSSYRPTPEKLIRDVTTASGYKKKIGIANMKNYSLIKAQKLEDTLFQVLTDTMDAECGNAELVTANDSGFIDIINAPAKLENGVVDNFTLSNEGRKTGYNAILTGALAAISTREERKGLWWFRKNHYYLKSLIFIDVYDTHDAAKLFSQPIISEIEISAEDAGKLETGQEISLPALKQHIEEIAENAGVDVCRAIDKSIWKGFVTESSGKDVTLSCGSDQGIRTGNQFEVFDSSRTMDGYQGQKFYVPGYKIGEIEISRVAGDQSKAKVLTADPLPVGSIVIPKY